MSNVKRKVTYRLYPTTKQESQLRGTLHLHQQLYNAALQQRIEAYRGRKISIGYVQQARELTQLRQEDKNYRNLNAQSSQVTLTNASLTGRLPSKRCASIRSVPWSAFKPNT